MVVVAFVLYMYNNIWWGKNLRMIPEQIQFAFYLFSFFFFFFAITEMESCYMEEQLFQFLEFLDHFCFLYMIHETSTSNNNGPSLFPAMHYNHHIVHSNRNQSYKTTAKTERNHKQQQRRWNKDERKKSVYKNVHLLALKNWIPLNLMYSKHFFLFVHQIWHSPFTVHIYSFHFHFLAGPADTK